MRSSDIGTVEGNNKKGALIEQEVADTRVSVPTPVINNLSLPIDNYGLSDLYQKFLNPPDGNIEKCDINSNDLSDNDINWFTQLIQLTDDQSAQRWKEGIRFAQVPRKNINKYIREQLTYRAIFDYLEKRKACVAKGCEEPNACDSKEEVLYKFFDELADIESAVMQSSKEGSSPFFILHDKVFSIASSFLLPEAKRLFTKNTTSPLTLRLLAHLPDLDANPKNSHIDTLYNLICRIINTPDLLAIIGKYEDVSKILLDECISEGIEQSFSDEKMFETIYKAIMHLSRLEDAKENGGGDSSLTHLEEIENGLHKLVSDAIAERVNRYSLSRKENDQAELTTDQLAVRVYRP